MKDKLHFSHYRALFIVAFGIFFNMASGQVTLSGSSYTQNFDSTSGGTLPTGWTVRTGGSTTALGTSVSLVASNAANNSWTNQDGNFRSAAANTSLGQNETNLNQQNSANRALAIRATSTFGAPGACFVLQLENTIGKGGFTLVMDQMILEPNGNYDLIYNVEYSTAADGNSGWTSIASDVNTSGNFGTTTVTYPISAGMNNHNGSVWIRIRVTSTAPVGFFDLLGIDNVQLRWNPTTTWNGTAWSNGSPSSDYHNTIIAGNYNTATNAAPSPNQIFRSGALTVNSGARFTVASGTSINVAGVINNNAGVNNFVLENNANIVQTAYAPNIGAITVKRNSSPIVRLDHTLWSSPVLNQTLANFSPNTLTNRFYTYNSSNDQFQAVVATSTMAAGRGYGVRAPNNQPVSPAAAWEGVFKGVPYNNYFSSQGFFIQPVTGNGFKLIGNPFPSAVDAAAFVNYNMNMVNNSGSNITGTLYFYAHTLKMDANGNFPEGTNYSTWNLGGYTLAANSSEIPNGIIQLGQGFFAKLINPSATDNDKTYWGNDMRVGNTQNQFYRISNSSTSTDLEKHRIWLNLTNPEGSVFNQIMIGYIAGTTLGVDNGYDGLAFGNEGSSLSTKIDGEDYVIQARPLPFEASDVVPVSFKAVTAGNYIISLSNMDGLFSENQDVFLKDNLSGTVHNLKSGSYTFNAAAGTFASRFEVVYQNQLSVPETAFTSDSVIAFKRSNVLNVQSKNKEMASIKAFDVQGRLIYSKSGINANEIALSDLRVQNGVLLLQVTSVEGVTATVKVIY